MSDSWFPDRALSVARHREKQALLRATAANRRADATAAENRALRDLLARTEHMLADHAVEAQRRKDAFAALLQERPARA